MARKKRNKNEEKIKEIHVKKDFPVKLIRQGLEAGFSFEQIVSFDTEESLQNAIGRFSPAILASAGKISKPKPAKPPVEMEVKTANLTLKLSPMRAKTPLRAEDEQRNIDAFVNRMGIRPAVTKMEIVRNYVPDENKYLTEIIISYKGPK
uniref:Uncharacterized protein n=1 Tax=viral metagenome TaxID=1070528 RepID=A0A6M3JAJ4_9ZZZZ